MADMNWFMQNAPQMQPGGGGFQEQQPGAVPLQNTGVTGPMGGGDMAGQIASAQASPDQAQQWFAQQPGGWRGGIAQILASRQSGGTGPFGGLMSAGQLGGEIAGQIASGQASPDQAKQWFGQQPGGWRGGVTQVMNAARGGPMMGNVLLRAPDGSTKSVPAGEMSHWLGRGAVRF